MNVFFYPAFPSEAAEHFRQVLQADVGLQGVIEIPGGCRLNSSLSLKLRSGDIMILFAAGSTELNELLALREEFEDFLIILVVMPSLCNESCREKSLQLAPRFITTPNDIHGLAAVIDKMLFRNEKTAATTPLSMEDYF